LGLERVAVYQWVFVAAGAVQLVSVGVALHRSAMVAASEAV
jgi:hypothetical protein